MQESGFIKLYRSLLSWEWYDDINTKTVFLHIMLKANWRESRYHGDTIHEGEYRTTVSDLASDLKLSIKSIRTALDHLVSTGEVTIRSTNSYSLITINNWGFFQQPEQSDQAKQQTNDIEKGKRRANETANEKTPETRMNSNKIGALVCEKGKRRANETANEGQTKGKRRANGVSLYKEEGKKERIKEDKKSVSAFAPPSLEEITNYVCEKNYTFSAERFCNYYSAQDWKRHGTYLKNWKELADEWQRMERNYSSGRNNHTERENSSFDINALSRWGDVEDIEPKNEVHETLTSSFDEEEPEEIKQEPKITIDDIRRYITKRGYKHVTAEGFYNSRPLSDWISNPTVIDLWENLVDIEETRQQKRACTANERTDAFAGRVYED